MKFVYFGYDFMLPAVRRLLGDGHSLASVFSFETDNRFNFNIQTRALAAEAGVPFLLMRPEDFHIAGFLDQGAEVFLSAGYPYKIPPVDEARAFAVNIHPTALPQARGLMPIPHIILRHMKGAAGFTAHKMTPEFDAGAIVLQQRFDLSPRETVETYSAKILMRAPDMAAELFQNLSTLWANARPQDEKCASLLKAPTERDRTLDWSKTANDLDTVARAFGRFGVIAPTEAGRLVAYDVACWDEPHSHAPGRLMARTARELTLACRDGYVCLRDFQSL